MVGIISRTSNGCWNGRVGAASCRRRLTTSHSRIIGRPRRLSLPQLVLPARRERSERTGFPSNCKGPGRRAAELRVHATLERGRQECRPSSGKRAPGMTPPPARSGGILAAWERRLSGAGQGGPGGDGVPPSRFPRRGRLSRRPRGGVPGGRSPHSALPGDRTPIARRKSGDRKVPTPGRRLSGAPWKGAFYAPRGGDIPVAERVVGGR